MVLENGVSLAPRTLSPCGNGALVASENQLGVSQCDQRILLVNTSPVTPVVSNAGGNLLKNPSFNGNGLGFLPEWKPVGLGYMPDLPRVMETDSFTSSIFLVTSRMDEYIYSLQGASQSIPKSELNSPATALYVGGWSKTYELTGTPDDNFGVLLDIQYEDGTSLFGQVLPFTTGTHDWMYSDRVVPLTRPVASINVTVILREHTGAAWVDDLVVSFLPKAAASVFQRSCNVGAFGDPRFKTLTDELYSFQTPGEYSAMLVCLKPLSINTN